MIDLNQLLHSLPAKLDTEIIRQPQSVEIDTVTADSRQARPGSLFVAIRGSVVDGHNYIPQAAQCSCIVVEEIPDPLPETTVVRVNDTHVALGILAAAIHDFPARSMTMIGLTGTNGKTTVSWMLEQMLKKNGCRVGVIGTVNYRYPDQSGRPVVARASLTTPDPVYLQQLLRTMANNQVTHVIIETSSHALVQGRLEGILFDIGVFTNLSRDHLDFHGSMEEYYEAKKLLFTRFLKNIGTGIIVTEQGEQEENWGQRLADELSNHHYQTLLTCGFDRKNSIHADKLHMDINGFSCELSLAGQQSPFTCPLTGRYNLLNVLSSAATGVALKMTTEQIIKGLRQLHQIPGRLQRVGLDGLSEDAQPAVFVDYAHTPDALKNVLQTLKPLVKRKDRGKLICIFGCGGDRDRGKRGLMGEVAASLADLTIITSDNPRSEDPETILDEIISGLRESEIEEFSAADLLAGAVIQGFCRITDRKKAIHVGCSLAKPEDIVLIAGKGHEDYQILGQKRIFFDDRIEAVNGLLHWNVEHLLKATSGRFSGHRQQLSDSVSTDTRTIDSGDIFVALAGENFDGHDYTHQAVKAGAGIVITHRDIQQNNRVAEIRVADTLRALGDMAGYRRRLLGQKLKVAAITGSSGKTTVKEMTAAIFNVHLQDVKTGIDPLLKTQGNFNNLIGLPLSLLPVQSGHKMAVLEMGMNRPGEIERLTKIANPDIGCITNVQAAHLEGLGSIQGVAAAKGELFAGMRQDTIAVVNYDDPLVRKLPKQSATTIGFAITAKGRRSKPAIRATRIVSCGEAGMRFTLHINDGVKEWKQRILVPAPGEHNVSNCAAAAAIAHAAGIDNETIVIGLANYTSVDKRMQFMTLPGGIQVVNDCYNANPASMAAALQTVNGFGADCRRIALLGDMLELGEECVDAHIELGRQVAKLGYNHLAVTGNFSAHVAEGATVNGMAEQKTHIFLDTHAMADWLYNKMIQNKITKGDWLLVKGSRGMRMEEVLQEIEHRFATGIEGGK